MVGSLSQQLATFEQQGISFLDVLSGKAAQKQLTGEQIMALLLSGIYDRLTGNQTPASLPQPLTHGADLDEDVVSLVDLTTVTAGAGSNFASFPAPFNGTAIMAVTLENAGTITQTSSLPNGTVEQPSQLLDGQELTAGQLKYIMIPINDGAVYAFASSAAGQITVQITGAEVLIQIQNPTVAIASNQTVDIGNSPVVQIADNQSVKIAGTPTVEISGTPTIDIGNTPAVTVTSGTITADISGPVTIQTASGTPILATITGTVNVAANQLIHVENASGGSLTIAGSVNIGNTPAVTISGTPNVAITSGSVNATIENATIDTQVVNTTSSPAINQSAVGSFDTAKTIGANESASTNGQYLLLNSGNYIKQIRLSVTLTNNDTSAHSGQVGLYNGNPSSTGTLYYVLSFTNVPAGSSQSQQIDAAFPNGFYNNGQYEYIWEFGSSTSVSTEGFILTASSTPNAITATIV